MAASKIERSFFNGTPLFCPACKNDSGAVAVPRREAAAVLRAITATAKERNRAPFRSLGCCETRNCSYPREKTQRWRVLTRARVCVRI